MSNSQIALLILSCIIISGYTTASDDSNYAATENLIPCEEGWYNFGRKCYKLGGIESADHVSQQNASNLCSKMGGKLASIHTKDENDFLALLLVLNKQQYVWIGMNYHAEDGHFVWEDGSSIWDYSNWRSGEPSDQSREGDCVQLHWDYQGKYFGKWIDWNCEEKLPFICQKASNSTLKSKDPRFCPSEDGGGLKFSHSCYKIINESKSWDGAEEFCQKTFDGHLVTIADPVDENFLNNILRYYTRHMWIGIKHQNESQLKWSSNWPLAFHRIEKDEDIQYGECILRFNSNHWISDPCEEKHPFICERRTDLAPYIQQKSGLDTRCPKTNAEWLDLGGDFCYYFNIEDSVTWNVAQSKCIGMGGLLASINSKEEESVFHHFIKHSKKTDIFVGLNDILTNGKVYTWSDGKTTVYRNWAEMPKKDKSENCALVSTIDMKWTVAPCTYKSGYICQIKKIPVETTCSKDNEDCIEVTPKS